MEMLLVGAKLKIELTEPELAGLPIGPAAVDYDNMRVRRFLIALLEQAKAQTGFSPKDSRLFVEILPGEAGGCIIWFTVQSTQGKAYPAHTHVQPVVFSFENAEHLCAGAGRLFRSYGQRIYKSALIYYRKRFTLILYPLDYSDQLSVYFLREYAHFEGEGEIFAAHVAECGTTILADCAIDTLAAHFD